MSVRDIRGHLEELYGLEVSPDLISRVTDAVLDGVKEWRSRALDAVYPVVIFDAPRVKIRDKDSRIVKNKAVYLALGNYMFEKEGRWAAFTRFLDDGRICLTNNAAERSLCQRRRKNRPRGGAKLYHLGDGSLMPGLERALARALPG